MGRRARADRGACGLRRPQAGPSPLRFTVDEDADIERAYRTHSLSAQLPERERAQLIQRQNRPPDLLVIAASKPWSCAGCGAEFGGGQLLMMEDGGPHCMECVDLGHLDFLPAGNTALTRRAKQASRLSAVVVRWSRSRKRYERQGILAEPDAMALAPDAVRLAMVAAVRHYDTDYEDLLMSGVSRAEARERVHHDVDRILADWSHNP